MPANRDGYRQWNVRLDPDLSAAIEAHLRDPMLVGLPKGKLAELFTVAIRKELEARGAYPVKATEPTTPVAFF